MSGSWVCFNKVCVINISDEYSLLFHWTSFRFFLLFFQFCSDPEGCLMKILTRLPASSPKLHVHNFPGDKKSAALSGKQLMHNRRWKIKKIYNAWYQTIPEGKYYTVCPTVILGRRLYHWHRPRVDIYPYIDSTQSSQKLSLDMLILGPQHFYVTW